VAARLEAYIRANDIAIIEQIRREAMAAADPLDKSFLTVAADLMEMQFASSELMQRARAIVNTGHAANIDTPIDERLQFQLRIADGLVKIHRALERNK
jgi:non-ribosomal peptide synthetase component E (peptide arylation enzyme)